MGYLYLLVFVDLSRFWLSLLYAFMIVSSYFYVHVLLFILLIVQLTVLNSVACTFVRCFSINTQYSIAEIIELAFGTPRLFLF